MKFLIHTFVLVFMFIAAVSAQTNESAGCATIAVSGGGIPQKGENRIFTATVEGYDTKSLTFTWRVSSGEIVSGQGTLQISVNNEREGENVTALIEVTGLPAGCPNMAAETGSVCYCVNVTLLDEYRKIPFFKEKLKLDAIADEISDSPNSQIFFVIYLAGVQNLKEVESHKAAIKKYLLEKHNILAERLDFLIVENNGFYFTKIWEVPRGAENPRP